jgi:hypothetical protein
MSERTYLYLNEEKGIKIPNLGRTKVEFEVKIIIKK